MYFGIQQLCTFDIKIECDRFHSESLSRSRLFTESESDCSQLPIHTISLKKCTLIFFFHIDLSRRDDRDLLASVDKSKFNFNSLWICFPILDLRHLGNSEFMDFTAVYVVRQQMRSLSFRGGERCDREDFFVVVGGKLWRIFLSSWLQPHAKRRVLDFSSAQDRWGISIGLNSQALKSSLSRTIVLKLDWPNNRIHELCIDTLR